jgi:hypothetical protein
MNMAIGESHVDPLTAYAAHPFADDQAYQVSRLSREHYDFTQADSGKAGVSSLYSSGTLDELSGDAKEDFLRRSRVFYFNQ